MTFIVYDLTIVPEPEDVERGHIGMEAVGHLKLDDALDDLTKRVVFSLTYEKHGDDMDAPDVDLPPEAAAALEQWRTGYDGPSLPPLGPALRIDSRDYAHVLQVLP